MSIVWSSRFLTSPAWYCQVLSVYNWSSKPKICFGCLGLDGNCRRFEIGGSLGRRVNVAACPSPGGSSARASAKGGERGGRRLAWERWEIPRPSCSSRAQVGCACSRGLQASTRERERAAPKRAPVSSSSPRGQPSLKGPSPSFYRRKERIQVYNGGCSRVLRV
jgi:hypothetical protein